MAPDGPLSITLLLAFIILALWILGIWMTGVPL